MKKIIAICCFLPLMISCKSQPKQNPAVEELLEKTKASLVFVEGGTFMMGHPSGRKAAPVHQVTLDNYSISKFETTFGDYDIFTNANDLPTILNRYRDPKNNSNTEDLGPKYGAWGMNWNEAKAYCQWLGEQLNIPMDLPTEAQWEYAARSRGLDVEHATDSGKIEGSYTEKRNYDGSDVIVGSFPPNPLGLYDMSGGRPEWTLDWYAGYPKTPVTNPVRDSIKFVQKRVVRGTHTLYYSAYSRTASEPENTGRGIGFRCVCNQKTPIN